MLKKLIIFVGGMAVGSIVGCVIAKRFMDKGEDEEIEVLSWEEFDKKRKARDAEKQNNTEAPIKTDMEEYEDEVIKYSRKSNTDEPYVIAPEEFGDIDGYEQLSLIYYADGTVTDSQDDIVDNVDEIIGSESLTHFGEYEDDSVFVRNDRLRADYEILLDQRTYQEAIKESKPWRKEELNE